MHEQIENKRETPFDMFSYFQMQPKIILISLSILLLAMPNITSSFLVSPLDPRVLSKVYSNERLTSHQKETIRQFIEKIKIKLERKEMNENSDNMQKVKRIYH